MARPKKTHTIEQPPEVNMEAVEESRDAERHLQGITEQYTEERDLVNQLLARVQLSKAMSKITDTLALSDLMRIKENKLYRALSGKLVLLPDGKTADVGTFAGFCEAIGLSRAKVDEDLLNLEAFGEEALASMNRVGLGYRDLRKLRKLALDEQQVIVGEVEASAGDKEAIVALIDELVTKHTKDKLALEHEVETLRDEAEAHERLIENKNRKIDELDKALHRRERLAGVELEAELARELEDETLAVMGSLMGLERAISQIADLDAASQQLRDARAYAMRRILTRIQELESIYDLVAVGPADDSWMQDVPSVMQPQAD